MQHRWGLSGRCECGCVMQVHGSHARPERLYWGVDGAYYGTRAPVCTRVKKTTKKAEQLKLFKPSGDS